MVVLFSSFFSPSSLEGLFSDSDFFVLFSPTLSFVGSPISFTPVNPLPSIIEKFAFLSATITTLTVSLSNWATFISGKEEFLEPTNGTASFASKSA